jgi:hypothetical protein
MASAIARLRRALAVKRPALYRLNGDGHDYIGPRRG